MSVSKDKQRGTWSVYIRYIDWQGNRKVHTKRGFKLKKDALVYERTFLQSKSRDVNMSFENFVHIYLEDKKPRLKYNTYLTKENIIQTKILPYFQNKSLQEITATDIIQWQNTLLQIRDEHNHPYSQTYLRTVQNQLSAIFNHAVKYYNLKCNPSVTAGKMGKAKAKEMLFWTMEEYLIFSEAMKKKPISFYAFQILYWCGIREGELLALTRKDIDLEKKTLTVNKSYQRLKGKDYITSPKSEKSNRTIDLPDFLSRELEDYFAMIYGCSEDTRLFPVSKCI